MGRSYTPTYRVETKENPRTAHISTTCWNVKSYGRPTQANVDKWRDAMNASFQPGGVNDHCNLPGGEVRHVRMARVVRQSSGEVVMTSNAPMFEVC